MFGMYCRFENVCVHNGMYCKQLKAFVSICLYQYVLTSTSLYEYVYVLYVFVLIVCICMYLVCIEKVFGMYEKKMPHVYGISYMYS